MALRIQTNVPVEVRLAAVTGEPAPSNFGNDQIKFRTDKGDLYVSEAVGAILVEAVQRQNVRPGEPVEIAKREVSLANGRKSIRWELTRVGFAPGEQADGTFVVPNPPPAAKPDVAARAAAAAPEWTQMLVIETNALVDAYAAVLRHSAKHEGLVKSEDIRSIFLSAFINVSKSGVRNAA